jgi:hypothetical protein
MMVLIVAVLFFSPGSCSRGGEAPSNPDNAAVKDAGADAPGTGYLDSVGWQKAKTEIKSVEEVLKGLFDDWGRAFGLAIQHRDFDQFDQAIAAARTAPGKVDAFVASIDRLKSIPNYPEFDEIRGCFVKMEPFMRNSSSLLEQSLVAGKAGNLKGEAVLKEQYTVQYREVMALGRRIFAIFTEIYTRGARTEWQDKTGVKVAGPEQVKSFREAAAKVAASYGGLLARDLPAADRYARGREWDRASAQADGMYASLQGLIMETGKMEPGNSKALWDARTTLTTALSYRMFHAQKLKEYSQKKKAGDDTGAAATTKVLDMMKKSADDEWAKFKKLRY